MLDDKSRLPNDMCSMISIHAKFKGMKRHILFITTYVHIGKKFHTKSMIMAASEGKRRRDWKELVVKGSSDLSAVLE